jgi:hypothetical protein
LWRIRVKVYNFTNYKIYSPSLHEEVERKKEELASNVKDPHSYFADPDPGKNINADPDP